MALGRNVKWIVLALFGALAAAAAAAWFLIVPGIIQSMAEDALSKAKEKTGRSITLGKVRLTGLSSAVIESIAVSDADNPDSTAVRADKISVGLSRIPFARDFSISSIDIDSINVTLRRHGGKTNFDDIIEKLKGGESDAETKTSAPSAWRRYITPFPDIHIDAISVAADPIKIGDAAEIGAVTASDIKIGQDSRGGDGLAYQIESTLSVLLIESGAPVTYGMTLAGAIQGAKKGKLVITCPVSKLGTVPEFMRSNGVLMGFDTAEFELPTSFRVSGLKVERLEDGKPSRPLIEADSARVRLMTLPPKKVSGVYFKEIELTSPKLYDEISEDGSFLMHWGKALRNQWSKPSDESEQAQAPSKTPSIKDRFFSQRMFMTGGSILIADSRKVPEIIYEVRDINAEIGYRSIRRILDYQISLHASSPVSSDIDVSGSYAMKTNSTEGALLVDTLGAAPALRLIQDETRVQLASGAPSLILQLLTAMHFDDASLSAKLDYHLNLDTTDFSVLGSIKSEGIGLMLESLSKEPIVLNGLGMFDILGNIEQRDFNLNKLEITTGGASLTQALHLKKENRVIGSRSAGHVPQTRDSYQFDVSVTLPDQPMQTLFEAIPHALRPDLDGMQWSGTLGFDFSATGYLDELSETKHAFELRKSPDFGVLSWPANRSIAALNTGMTLKINDPNALTEHLVRIPPSIYASDSTQMGTAAVQGPYYYVPSVSADDIRANNRDWVIFDDINPWLIQLITTTEDGSFFTHDGFSPMQIKAALARNVSRNAFSRGASTISMQLIKNIYFDRTKSIARKFQEFLYTWLMESVVQVPKQRILELYFNIIEFGPEIYGIEEASKYYFGKRSADLSLKESAYLMAIIPNPRSGAQYRLKPEVSSWLQKTMNFYIKEMYRRKCDPETLSKMRARYARRGQALPFEPCCPPKDSLQLMLDADTMSFYVPNPSDPLEYAYHPDLYTPDGSLLIPRQNRRCGVHDTGSSMESIFEELGSEDVLPSKEELGLP